LRRNTLELRPQLTTLRKRYRATSSGLSRRWPLNVHVTPYSFSIPKIRRSTASDYAGRAHQVRDLLGGTLNSWGLVPNRKTSSSAGDSYPLVDSHGALPTVDHARPTCL
jgi:hypothetical protein